MAAHRYWRIYLPLSGYRTIVELELRETYGGADVTAPGMVITADSFFGSYVAANVIDNSNSTLWESTSAGSFHWLLIDLGVGNAKDILEVMLRSYAWGAEHPTSFDVQYSDDGTSFTTARSFTGIVWGSQENKVFQLVDLPGVRVEKAVAYAVTVPPLGTSVSKALGYVVLATADATVTFGGIQATNVVVIDENTLECDVPSHATGAVDVVAYFTDGSLPVTGPSAFTYDSASALNSVSPATGTVAGGKSVTLSGLGFTGATGVTFGGVAAPSFNVVNDTTITCTTPAHAVGAVTVAVTGPFGSLSLPAGYTFTQPVVSSLSPNQGPMLGGTGVTITGQNFTADASVDFGGVPATAIVVVSGTEITCTVPAHAVGAVTVSVTADGGTGTKATAYTYVGPSLTAVAPNTGAPGGGTLVTLTGTVFAAGMTVRFDGVLATEVTVIDTTTATCRTPANPAGPVDVWVTVNGSSSQALIDGFTYAYPAITTTPNHGPTYGGNRVRVTY